MTENQPPVLEGSVSTANPFRGRRHSSRRPARAVKSLSTLAFHRFDVLEAVSGSLWRLGTPPSHRDCTTPPQLRGIYLLNRQAVSSCVNASERAGHQCGNTVEIWNSTGFPWGRRVY